MAKTTRHGGPIHVLDAESVTKTLERLSERIDQRFPEAGLARVCRDLVQTAKTTAARVRTLSRPYFGLRFLVLLTLIGVVSAQIYVIRIIDWRHLGISQDAAGLAQGLDAMVNLLLLAGGAIWFLLTAEQRLKRRRTMRALFQLRSFAHVVDMHQLTKDPTIVLGGGQPTPASPERRMTQFELSRYLEYCSEMLALISKLAALYAGATQDETIITAVNEMEELTSDLGRKIWQKIMILSQLDERAAVRN